MTSTARDWALPVMDTGVPNLNLILGGGIPKGALALIVGPSGSGKTTLAGQIAFAVAAQEHRALVLTALSEPTSKLVAQFQTFRFFDHRLVGGPLQIMSLEQYMARGLLSTGDEVRALVREVAADVVVIDGFRGMRGADTEPQMAREFLYDVGSSLSLRGTTTLITSEADSRGPAFFPELTTADVIVVLHFRLAGVRHLRAIESVKVRGGAPLPGLHGMVLDANGVTIYPRLEARVAAPGRFADGEGPLPARQATGPGDLDILAQARARFDLPPVDDALAGGLVRTTLTLVTGSLGTGKTTLGLRFLAANRALDVALDPVGMVADNVVLLQHYAAGDELRYSFSALKTRFTPHDAAVYEFVIGPPEGIRFLGTAVVAPPASGEGEQARLEGSA